MNSKIALVTGGNRGLGQNTVLHLARRGVDSILTYRSHSAEAETVVDEAERLGAHAIGVAIGRGGPLDFRGLRRAGRDATRKSAGNANGSISW